METPVSQPDEPAGIDDRHGLSRFMRAQANDYDRALAELRSGRKRSHWMWYIVQPASGADATESMRLR